VLKTEGGITVKKLTTLLAVTFSLALIVCIPEVYGVIAGPHNALPFDPAGAIAAGYDPDQGEGVCYACHLERSTAVQKQTAISNGVCFDCHSDNPATPPLVSIPEPATLANLHSSAVTGSSRFTYEVEKCANCHNPHAPDLQANLGWSNIKYTKNFMSIPLAVTDNTQNPPLDVTKQIFNYVQFTSLFDFVFADPGAYVFGACNTCHSQTNHHRNVTLAPFELAPGDLDANGNYIGHNDTTRCTDCHTHVGGFAPTGGVPVPPHDTQPFVEDCTLCHVEVGGTVDFAAKVPDAKCDQCHTPTGSLKSSFPTAPDVLNHSDANGSGKYTYTIDCVDCHDPMFQQPNIKLTRSNIAASVIANSSIEFTTRSGPGSFADGPPHPENVCETCHQVTNHHRFDGSAPADNDTGGYIGHFDSQDCAGCHAHGNAFLPELEPPPPPHTAFDCEACHLVDANGNLLDAVVDAPIENSKCNGCHATGTPDKPNGGSDIKIETHYSDTYTDPTTGDLASLDCVECHNPMRIQTNFRNNTNLAFIRTVVRDTPVAFEAKTGPYSFADDTNKPADMATENYVCNTCHSQTNHHQADGVAPGGQSHNDGVDCTGCHAHNAGFILDAEPPPAPHNAIDCEACHLTPDSFVFDADIPNSACDACHAEGTPGAGAGGSDTKVGTHFSDTYTDPTTGLLMSLNCVECHNPMRIQTNFRSNTNLAFIRTAVRGSDVAFEAKTGPYSFADNTNTPGDMATENYVCITCHTQTNHHQNDGTAPGGQSHNDGLDCSGCHPHLEGFQPVGGGNCLVCHNQSPPVGSTDSRRRQIVEFQPGDGGGDFVLTSHHVVNGPTSSQVVSPDDCLVCHDQSAHTTFGDGVSVLLADQDGGPSYTYNGVPVTAEDACLSCHDGNHPKPFPSDNNNPPNIKSGWSDSSHKASGQASCLDCHAQGHGSDFEKILPEANQPGLCYNCHSPNGPGDDIESEFMKAHRHPVEASNSEIQCQDCHNPHQAKPTNKIAGVSGVTVTGQVKSGDVYVYELCLKCHTDQQREFNPAATQSGTGLPNTGYHAVAAPGRSISSALFNQLRSPFNLSTKNDLKSLTIQCTDCHNSEVTGTVRGPVTDSNLRATDKPSKYTGSQPTGPHGSRDSSSGNSGEGTVMLRDTYRRDVGEGRLRNYNPANFALCFKCHDSRVFNDEDSNLTRFEEHEKHVNDEEVSCAACHWNTHSNVDPPNTQYVGLNRIGPATLLINFAPGVVRGNNSSKPQWGYFSGEGEMGCNLRCHGEEHDPETYGRHPSGDSVNLNPSVPGGDDCTDNDGDGYGIGADCLGSDCDDSDPAVNPGQTEICGNGIDDNCDGTDAVCPAGDVVTITRAEWDEDDEELEVWATSSKNGNASLIAHYRGKTYSMRYRSWRRRFELRIEDVDFSSTVQVTSSLGGSASKNVIRKD